MYQHYKLFLHQLPLCMLDSLHMIHQIKAFALVNIYQLYTRLPLNHLLFQIKDMPHKYHELKVSLNENISLKRIIFYHLMVL